MSAKYWQQAKQRVLGSGQFLAQVEQVFVDLLIVIDPYVADYVSLINFAQKIRETKKFP